MSWCCTEQWACSVQKILKKGWINLVVAVSSKIEHPFRKLALCESSSKIRVSKFVAENVFNNVILNWTMNVTMNLTKSDKGLKQNYLFSSGFLLLWLSKLGVIGKWGCRCPSKRSVGTASRKKISIGWWPEPNNSCQK